MSADGFEALRNELRLEYGLWGSFLLAAAELKTPTRNSYNIQGANLDSCYLCYAGGCRFAAG